MKNPAKLYKALGELEATWAAQYLVRDCAVQGLHSARRAFYDGARARAATTWSSWCLRGRTPSGPWGKRSMVFLKPVHRGLGKLFVWAARLARRKAPRAAPWVSLGRAKFELSLERHDVARRAAARAVRFARRERDLRTEADAWRVLARIERGSSRAAVFVDRARKADARDAARRSRITRSRGSGGTAPCRSTRPLGVMRRGGSSRRRRRSSGDVFLLLCPLLIMLQRRFEI